MNADIDRPSEGKSKQLAFKQFAKEMITNTNFMWFSLLHLIQVGLGGRET